ncbi:MAG TPA: PDZ domain-containing protein [Gaiellaceae bacterium]|nr:PDZ domain-containing protein [Gaiellaceae bacterium]
MKRLSAAAALVGALGLVAALLLWSLPADDFIFTPDRAKPLADRVEVEANRPAASGEVYYVDVFVRRTRLLERLLPFTRPEGSTVVPEHALLPPGTEEEERDRRIAEEMRRSERVAAVVALRALGYDVRAIPRGALVVSILGDVPAARVLEEGDVIVSVDGRAVRTPAELRREIGRRAPGDRVRLGLRRGRETREVTVRTVRDPSNPERAIVGIQVDQDADIRLPFDVEIDLGQVGGPSAGLPFALEIARQLGRDVTHGCRVAATGELALDGSVLPVGGVQQKTIGALRADVDLFLVPAGANAQEARRNADGLRVLPVESFQQALQLLATTPLKC